MLTDQEKSQIRRCYQRAIKLLSLRDYSIIKLKDKLKKSDFEDNEIESVINQLVEKNLLREDEYVRSRIKAFIRKGYSKKYISLKLKQEKIIERDDFINDIYLELDMSEELQKNKLIEKRKNDDPDKIKRYLYSKGHFEY